MATRKKAPAKTAPNDSGVSKPAMPPKRAKSGKSSSGSYVPLTDVERVLIYEYLERIQEDVPFRQAILENPEVVFAVATSKLPLSKLLRPNLLDAMGKLRRVALEEIGIDVAPYRDDMMDNGFKLIKDHKK